MVQRLFVSSQPFLYLIPGAFISLAPAAWRQGIINSVFTLDPHIISDKNGSDGSILVGDLSADAIFQFSSNLELQQALK